MDVGLRDDVGVGLAPSSKRAEGQLMAPVERLRRQAELAQEQRRRRTLADHLIVAAGASVVAFLLLGAWCVS